MSASVSDPTGLSASEVASVGAAMLLADLHEAVAEAGAQLAALAGAVATSMPEPFVPLSLPLPSNTPQEAGPGVEPIGSTAEPASPARNGDEAVVAAIEPVTPPAPLMQPVAASSAPTALAEGAGDTVGAPLALAPAPIEAPARAAVTLAQMAPATSIEVGRSIPSPTISTPSRLPPKAETERSSIGASAQPLYLFSPVIASAGTGSSFPPSIPTPVRDIEPATEVSPMAPERPRALAQTPPPPNAASALAPSAPPNSRTGGSALREWREARADNAGAASFSAPMSAAPPARQTSGPTGGDVFLDGVRVGRWLSDTLAREAGGPANGGAGFDPRLGPTWPGALQGNSQ